MILGVVVWHITATHTHTHTHTHTQSLAENDPNGSLQKRQVVSHPNEEDNTKRGRTEQKSETPHPSFSLTCCSSDLYHLRRPPERVQNTRLLVLQRLPSTLWALVLS